MNTSPQPRRPVAPTPSSPPVGPPAGPAPRRRRVSAATRRPAAALGATLLISASLAGGPLAAVGSAQSSGGALQQSGAAAAQSAPMTIQEKGRSSSAPGTSQLNVAPNFDAPGIKKGETLIGWAKAGALIIGTLTLIIGIPMSKALKEAGNHHASGVRAGAMGVGGAILLAGVAGSALPWLMNV